MAGYPVFQAQGPVIPINLYAENAQAGANIAKSVGNPYSAAITGAIEGYNQGQQIALNSEKIEQEELQNELLKNKVETERLTKQADADLAVLKSQNELAAAKQQAQDVAAQKKIADSLSSSDLGTRLSILDDSNAQNLLLRNPKLAEQVYGRLSADMSPDQKEKAFAAINFSKEMELQNELQKVREHEKAQSAQNLEKIVRDVQDDGQLSYLRNSSGLDITQMGDIKTYPAGTKHFNKDGTLDTSGKPDKSQSDQANLDAKPGKYDVVINGKRANILLDETSNKALQAWQLAGRNLGLFKDAPVTQVLSSNAAIDPNKQFSGKFQNNGVSLLGSEATSIPQANPEVTARPGEPAPTDINTPESDQALNKSSNPIVSQRMEELLNKAKTDKDLENRLVAKGLLKLAPPGRTPPTATPTAPVDTASPIAQPGNSGTTGTNPSIPAPKELLQKVNSLSLSTPAKKYVSTDVVKNVISNQYLQGLSPSFQAVAAVESGGKTDATSPTGVKGLFQLTKATAGDLGVNRDNPAENVQGGVAYLNQLMTRYGGKEVPAYMAYNVGPKYIDAAIDLVGSTNYEDIVYGLTYLKGKGYFPELSYSRIAEATKYPAKVLAYKEAFGALVNA